MKLLIADDEDSIRRGVSKYIQLHTDRFDSIYEAENGQQALDIIFQYQPEIVILDVQMPLKNGIEVMEESAKVGLHPITIILSGYDEFKYAQQAIKYGAKQYLLKPTRAADLLECINKLTDKYYHTADDEINDNEEQSNRFIREALPETIAVRNQLYQESGRISSIGISVLDSAWTKEIKPNEKMLFIIEGLSMYLTAEENSRMLKIIHDNFDHAYVCMECIAKMWAGKENVEKSIQKTGAKFIFGADCFEDLGKAGNGFRKVKDDNILRGIRVLSPALRLIDWLPIAKKMTQKILIFEKVEGNKG